MTIDPHGGTVRIPACPRHATDLSCGGHRLSPPDRPQRSAGIDRHHARPIAGADGRAAEPDPGGVGPRAATPARCPQPGPHAGDPAPRVRGPGAGRHRSLADRGVQPARGRAEPDQPQRRPADAGARPAGRPGEQSRRQPRFPAPLGRAAGRVRSPPARTSSPHRHGTDRRHQRFAGPLAIFAPARRARRREPSRTLPARASTSNKSSRRWKACWPGCVNGTTTAASTARWPSFFATRKRRPATRRPWAGRRLAAI